MIGEGLVAKRQRASFGVSDELHWSQKNETIVNNPLHQQQLAAEPESVVATSSQRSGSIPSSSAAALVVVSAEQQQRRLLCTGKENHCFTPQEKNVFSPPTPTPPTPAPTSLRTDPDACVSDGQGNYGDINGPSARTVEYRYQVETTPKLTAILLNLEVLQDVEKAISDLLVKRFFLETCSPPVIDVILGGRVIPKPTIVEPPQPPPVVLSKLFTGNKEEDVITKSAASDDGHKFRLRRLKSEDHQNLVGLSAAPEDLVLDGWEGEACPFSTTDGPCFVIGGGVTVFGDNPEGNDNNNGLLWVDEPIQEELQQAMNSGDLDKIVQEEHPDVIAIRYIPPGTKLVPPKDITDPDGVVGNNGLIGGRTTALSWVLIGLGLIILLGVFLYTIAYRRQSRREEEERTAVVVGAFPIVVSNENIAQAQEAHFREEAMSNSSNNYGLSSPGHSRRRSPRSNDSDSDNEVDEGIPLHVFHDDENSPAKGLPKGISTSWRDQILRNPRHQQHHDETSSSAFGGGISLDPNQPIVRPILNDENDIYSSPTKQEFRRSSHSQSTQFHSANSGEDDFPSGNVSYFVGSSLSGSPRSSPSKEDSPSKLSQAFDQSEII